jgi:TrmH family RNA methyltransferase
VITSASNPRIKALRALSEPRERRRAGLCLIEGQDEIRFAFTAGTEIQTLFYAKMSKSFSENNALMVKICAAGAECTELSPDILARIAYREHPDALLAIAKSPPVSLADLEKRLPPTPNHTLVILADVEKPGNIGAALRSLDAAGYDGLIAASCQTDLFNPNVIRASRGSVFTVPAAECETEEALTWLKKQNYVIFALHPGAGKAYYNYDYRQHQTNNTAFVFGAEHEGLSSVWLQSADIQLAIPMFGAVNSLNIAQAVTLALYEKRRADAFP